MEEGSRQLGEETGFWERTELAWRFQAKPLFLSPPCAAVGNFFSAVTWLGKARRGGGQTKQVKTQGSGGLIPHIQIETDTSMPFILWSNYHF